MTRLTPFARVVIVAGLVVLGFSSLSTASTSEAHATVNLTRRTPFIGAFPVAHLNLLIGKTVRNDTFTCNP